jgi:hypothetical protein
VETPSLVSELGTFTGSGGPAPSSHHYSAASDVVTGGRKASPAESGHTGSVAERGLLYGDRTWFFDSRTPVRRMAVSAHPDEGVVVISLWQGDRCAGTFRLPVQQTPAMIAALADALVSGAAPSGTMEAERRLPSVARWWRRRRDPRRLPLHRLK